MTKGNSTKKALLASVLSLVLCFTMLIGSTFAWFTDSATTGVNTIQAGNLDVMLMMKDGENWVDAEGEVLNFKKAGEASAEPVLFEPGATYELPTLRIDNNGTLALKFKLLVNGVSGDMKLAELLRVKISVDGAEAYDAGTLYSLMTDEDGAAYGVLKAKEKTSEYTIALHMPTSAGNEYMNMKLDNMAFTVIAAQLADENDSYGNQYDSDAIYADVLVNSVEEFKAALAVAEKGDVIGFAAGTYDFNNETVNIDKAVSVVGSGDKASELQNVIFDVDSSTNSDKMEFVLENLKITGVSRTVVGMRSHSNGVGGPDVIPLTALTIRNCEIKNTINDSAKIDYTDKGQFVFLYATYTVKIDLTMIGNTMVNAHTITGEDSAPIVNGNGTIINNVCIANNTFGDAENPCDRYALKFARRCDGANIVVSNNTVYGATTAEKDFYILDLWQSGGNAYAGLYVSVDGNTVNCQPNDGRAAYGAYIEATVKGTDIDVNADCAILDSSVKQ